MANPSEDETAYLRQFVLDYCDGKLVTLESTDRATLLETFPPLRRVVDEFEIPEDAALIWTYASELEGRHYYPYFSLNYLTKAQTERVWMAIAVETERRRTIKV